MHLQNTSGRVAGQPHLDLVLARLPSGQYAWLKPCAEAFEDEDALFWITEKGRHDLRMAELFGPSPTVDQVRRGTGVVARQP
jgi:hypothetical protein